MLNWDPWKLRRFKIKNTSIILESKAIMMVSYLNLRMRETKLEIKRKSIFLAIYNYASLLEVKEALEKKRAF